MKSLVSLKIFVGIFLILSFVGVGGAVLLKSNLDSLSVNSGKVSDVKGVADLSRVPRFINVPEVSAIVGKEYEYDAKLFDSNVPSDKLSVILKTDASWLSLEGNVLKGSPTANDIGNTYVELVLSNGTYSTTKSFYIVVNNE